MDTAVNHPGRLGDFDILRELGRGGMGIVYEAWQISLKRKVALKILSPALVSTPKAVERFHREAEAAAKLHHTNIVPVYSTGETDETHYYAMEYLPGPSLDVIIRRLYRTADLEEAWKTSADFEPNLEPDPSPTPDLFAETQIDLSPDAEPAVSHVVEPQGSCGDQPEGSALKPAEDSAAEPSDDSEDASLDSASKPTSPDTPQTLPSGDEYFKRIARSIASVADALDHAHQQGIIHRDIKPSNLLLASDGRLSINDFGLARLVNEPGVTCSGEILGSPTYMSPEQVAAGRVPVDHRTDIYSLGATLYELLTLRPLFPGRQRDQVLAQIIQKDPARPQQMNRDVPADLETICLKSLERDPDRRYQTAGEFAADLRRFASSSAIAARRPGPVARTVRWTRRRPAIASLLAILACVLAVAAFLSHRWYEAEAKGRLAQDVVTQLIARSESRGREVFDRRNEIVAACWIRPGMVVADVGAGTGFFTRLFSSLVGSEGHVFAVDVSQALVDHIRKTAETMRLDNVTAVKCDADSVRLADRSIDLAFLCDTYRYFRSPQKNMESIRRALKPGGTVVVIDSHRSRSLTEESETGAAPRTEVTASPSLIEEIESVGFKLVGVESFLRESYFLRFEKRAEEE